MKKYLELSIKDEQKMHLDILRLFNEMCLENNIPYFAAYGTLLGAVREKGFIDWDDDVDLWMFRKDIKQIKELFYTYFDSNKYFYQDLYTDVHSISPEIVRICINDTFKWPMDAKDEKFHKGIYFDIFPLDYLTNGDFSIVDEFTKAHINLYKTLHHSTGIKSYIKYFFYRIIPRSYFRNKVISFVELLSSNPESRKLIALPATYGGNNGCIFQKEYFEETVFLDFEDLMISCPKCYDLLLKQIYGLEYMVPKRTKPEYIHAYILEDSK